jgi:hypothetical protein
MRWRGKFPGTSPDLNPVAVCWHPDNESEGAGSHRRVFSNFDIIFTEANLATGRCLN